MHQGSRTRSFRLTQKQLRMGYDLHMGRGSVVQNTLTSVNAGADHIPRLAKQVGVRSSPGFNVDMVWGRVAFQTLAALR